MQRLLLVLLITTGAVSLGSCGLFGRGDSDVATDDVVIEAVPTTTPSTETSDGELPNLPEGEDGNVVAVSTNSPTVVARDLIQSTNANERAIGVERTRPDPFAGLTIPLVPPQPIEVEGANRGGSAGGVSSQANGGGSGNTGATSQANGGSNASQSGSGSQGNTASNGGQPNEKPTLAEPRQIDSSIPEIAALPEIPQPTTAQAVRVTGVIQVGGDPYAIIKAPDEIERYVRQGERVARGRVLVKRIETRTAEPRVVLVENGIEVERFVTAADEPIAEETPPEAETVSTISTLPALPSSDI